MNFYEITTRKTRNNNDVNEMKNKCRECTDELYMDLDGKVVLFVEDITEFTCTLSAAVMADVVKEYSVEKLVDMFNKISGLELRIKNSKEILLRTFHYSLKKAKNDEYIDSADRIISDFKLEHNYYDEFIAQSVSRRKIEDMSQELLYDKSLIPEIDRIYKVKNETYKLHHPVHYIVRSDNDDEYKDIVEYLISALYENNRIFSKRYCKFDVDGSMNTSSRELTKYYTFHRGGTVVFKVEMAKNSDSSFECDSVCEELEEISRVINRFNNDVLTIFVMPQVCEKETEAIYKYVETAFVEITPENASGERARKYLSYKAKKVDIPVNDSLFEGIDDEKALGSNDLSERFADWYSNYVRNEMYPQYSEIKRKKIAENDSHFGKALKELNEMIGLTSAKKIVHNALDYYKVQKMYKQLEKKVETPSMHMVFTGNPGTAKTTVARLFAQILKDNDVITNGRLVEVGRADLVGKYVGHTAPLVKRAFEAAEGGVLFIDEAYSLLDRESGMYGDEAINTIVQEMENHRNSTIVIFAGYPNEMEEFLNRNPGLKSRIAFHVPFEDYSTEELVEITKLIAKNRKNRLCDDVIAKLGDIFDNAVKINDFGNGRYARNIIEKAELNRASRLAKLSFDEVTRDMLETFIPEDFEVETTHKAERKKIGFV